jgi:hypothetical protein
MPAKPVPVSQLFKGVIKDYSKLDGSHPDLSAQQVSDQQIISQGKEAMQKLLMMHEQHLLKQEIAAHAFQMKFEAPIGEKWTANHPEKEVAISAPKCYVDDIVPTHTERRIKDDD